MAKNPKFLKNILTTASAVALVGFSATSTIGAFRITNDADATARNGVGVLTGFIDNDFVPGIDRIQLDGAHNVTTSGALDHSNGTIDINGHDNQTFTVGHAVTYGAGLDLAMNLVVNNAGSITLRNITHAADNVTVNGGTVIANNVSRDLTNTAGTVTVHDVTRNLTNIAGTVTVNSIGGTAILNDAGTTRVTTNIGELLTVQNSHTTEVGGNLHSATFITDEVITLKGNNGHIVGIVTVIPTGGAGTFIADEMTSAADTLRFTADVGAVGNPLKLIQAKGGGKIRLEGNTYTKKIDVGVSDTTVTLTGANHKIEALTHANNAVTLEVDHAATVLVAGTNISSANNRLKAVKFNDAKTLILQDGVNIFAINSGNVVDTGITTARDGSGSLAFEGDSTVNAVFTRPIGCITSANAANTVQFTQAVKVSTAAGDTGVIGVGTDGTMQFGSDVTAKAIQGKVANQGTAEFNNAQAAKVTVEVAGGGLLALKVSGSNLTFDNKLAKAASYDFGTQAANITVAAAGDLDIAASTITTQSNAGNQNFIVGGNLIVGKAGAADKHFGSFILATANKVVAVTQADFHASVGTNNAGEGNAEFIAVDGKVDNIGTSDKPMKVVNFIQNTTVFGNSYAKEVSIDAAMTGTFHKEVGGGKVTLTIDAIGTFKDGSTLLSTLNPTTNRDAIVNFEGGTTIKQGVAASDKHLAALNFLDDAGKTQALAGDFYATDISLLKTIVHADADVLLHGTVRSIGTTYDAGVMNIILNGFAGIPSTFSGDLTFKSTYDGSNNGQLVVNTVADFAGATKITLALVDNATKRPSVDGIKVTIFNIRQELENFDLAKVQAVLPASNRFVTWTFDKPNLTFIANDRTEQGTLEVLQQGASDRAQENAKALVNINNTSDAGAYGTELFNLGNTDEKALTESIERFLSPSTAQASQAVSEAISEAGSIITSRMQTLASPLQVTSLDGVAAGEQDAARYGVWGSQFYNQGIQNVRKSVSGYKSKSFGGTVGFDTMANDTMIIGLAATAVKTDLKHRDTNAGDKTKANTVMLSIYGLQQINEDWFLQSVANFGSTRVNNSAKRIGFANGAKTSQIAAAKYDSMSWGGEVMAGYTFKMSDLAALTPVLGLDYTRITDSGYTETGTTSQNQIVSKKSMDKINLVAGVRGVLAPTDYSGVTITPEAHAFVIQALGNKKAKIDIKLNGMVGTLAPFNIKPAKTFYNIGLGLNAQSGMMDYGLTYDAHLANKYVGHQGTLKVRVNF